MEVIFIKEPIIQQLCYNMAIGITEPKYALLSNGIQAIVKLSNGPEGNPNQKISMHLLNI